MYDLNLIPIHIRQGDPIAQPAGFHSAAPPRRAVRSRSEDMLILSLFIQGSAGMPPETQHEMLDQLTQAFFKTSGSVTAALRMLIETLNLIMLEKNLKAASHSRGTSGALTVASVHRHDLYLAQSGEMHAFVIAHQGLQHFGDASQNDRGLGFSRTPSIHFYQANLGTGGYLFTSQTAPETWTEDVLLLGQFPTLPQLRRRLLHQAPPDFRTDLVQIIPGEGEVHILQPKEQTPASTLPVSVIGESRTAQPTPDSHAEPQHHKESLMEESSDTQEVKVESHPRQTPIRTTPSETSPTPKPAPAKKTNAARKETVRKQSEKLRKQGLKGMAAFFGWWQNVRQRVNHFFKGLMSKLSPEGAPKFSKGTLLLIAVIVPLVVAGIAVGVYLARGRTLQYNYYLNQAVTTSQNALAAEEPSDSRDKWIQVMAYLDQAESHRTTVETEALRDQAQDALDLLDGAVRLKYHPAIIGSLYSEINITRIVSFGTDLYLFDAAGGRVIHAERTSQGYEVDPDFTCASGNFNGAVLQALVDMTSLPINNPYQAHILAVDELGNAAYCAPGEDPIIQALPASSGMESGIKRIVYESGYLYALDSAAGTVRVYESTNGQLLQAPTDFFDGADAGEKPDISQITDIDVNGQELYLLREDGMLVDCISSGLAGDPVICENPVTYVDGRTGKEDQPVIMPDAEYTTVLYTDPPDPSIAILETANADIYQFSLRFKLYKRLRPDLGDYEIETPTATAFTMGIDRIAFLAFGNQVFYAYIE